ncbi:MAG TPA: cell division protein FtsN [Pasteurellaceae bacterium]|nr:cell division protein FtsN [Pasteurellaceae bacterium]
MAQQRDYAVNNGNSKKKKGSGSISKTLLLMITLLVVVLFAFGLYLLKEKSSEPSVQTSAADKSQSKSQLPSRPEEVWSYIKELESRTVVTDNSQQALEKNMQLSDKQKEELLRMEEKEKQAALEKAIEKLQAEEQKSAVDSSVQQSGGTVPATSTAKDEAALKVEQMKAAELAKQAAQKKAAEQKKAVEIETAKPEPVKVDERKKVTVAKDVKKEETKKTETVKTSGGSFGLQCGAFKNRQQAENLQGRLVMAGLDARVSSNADWNRVFVGPVGDRAAGVNAQKKASSVINCVIIGM